MHILDDFMHKIRNQIFENISMGHKNLLVTFLLKIYGIGVKTYPINSFFILSGITFCILVI